MEVIPTEISQIQNVLKYDPTYEEKGECILESKKNLFAEQLEAISRVTAKFGNRVLVILACMSDLSHLPILIKEFPETKFLVIANFINNYRSGSPIYDHMLLKFDSRLIGSKIEKELAKNAATFKKFDGSEIDMKSCDNFDDLSKLYKFMNGDAPCAVIADHYDAELAKKISKSISLRRFGVCFISELKEKIGCGLPDYEVIFGDQKNQVFAKIIAADLVFLKSRFPYAIASDLPELEKVLRMKRVVDTRREFKRLFKGPDNWDLYKKYLKSGDEKEGCPYRTFDGVFAIRPWSSRGASETRLISTSLELKQYNCHDYENRMFTVRILRSLCRFDFFGKSESFDETLEKVIILKFAARKMGFAAETTQEFLNFYKENRECVDKIIAEYKK